MRSLAIFFVLLGSICFGQIKNQTEQPGLVELKPAEIPDGATYRWKAIFPFDLEYREYLTLDAKQRICLLNLQKGKYVVDLIVTDWDKRMSYDVRHIIDVVGPDPVDPVDPVDPDPVDPVDPDPVDPAPAPDNLPAFGKVIREMAISSKLPVAQAVKLVEPIETVASMAAAGRYQSAAEARSDLAKRTLAVVKEWPEADYTKAQAIVAAVRKRSNMVLDFPTLAKVFEDAAAGLKSLRK